EQYEGSETRIAVHFYTQWKRADAHPLIEIGIDLLQTLRQDIHFGLRLLKWNIRFQPGHDIPPRVEATDVSLIPSRPVKPVTVSADRRPEFGFAGRKLKGRRHNADNLKIYAVNLHPPTYNIRRPPEPAVP